MSLTSEEIKLTSFLESIESGDFNSIEITVIGGKPAFVKQKYTNKEIINFENLNDILKLIKQVDYGTIKLSADKKNIEEIIKSIKLT